MPCILQAVVVLSGPLLLDCPCTQAPHKPYISFTDSGSLLRPLEPGAIPTEIQQRSSMTAPGQPCHPTSARAGASGWNALSSLVQLENLHLFFEIFREFLLSQ